MRGKRSHACGSLKEGEWKYVAWTQPTLTLRDSHIWFSFFTKLLESKKQ